MILCLLPDRTYMATGRDNSRITFPELEARYRLPEESLDERCSIEHLLHVASQVKSWELLAAYLGLDDTQIEAIKKDNDREEGRRIAILTTWEKNFAFKATYGKLIQALLAIKRADLACEVCELIAPHQGRLNEQYTLDSQLIQNYAYCK